uniref:Uncharacterized protein n=1 Tax=Plectus sambesii TaxID=2011161 RepID=A0A914V7Y3_9BILA
MLPLLLSFLLVFSIGEAQQGGFAKTLGKTDGLAGVDDLDVAYSPLTAGEHWVMASGNSTAISTIWSALAMEKGRIVSDGDFCETTTNRRKDYVIVHSYEGPVFLRPAPVNQSELVRLVRDNHARSAALTRVCGREVVPSNLRYPD